jgi:hypothetical protein
MMYVLTVVMTVVLMFTACIKEQWRKAHVNVCAGDTESTNASSIDHFVKINAHVPPQTLVLRTNTNNRAYPGGRSAMDRPSFF